MRGILPNILNTNHLSRHVSASETRTGLIIMIIILMNWYAPILPLTRGLTGLHCASPDTSHHNFGSLLSDFYLLQNYFYIFWSDSYRVFISKYLDQQKVNIIWEVPCYSRQSHQTNISREKNYSWQLGLLFSDKNSNKWSRAWVQNKIYERNI